jgi:two-component sensor histidine kinase
LADAPGVSRLDRRLSLVNRTLASQTTIGMKSGTVTRKHLLEKHRRYLSLYRTPSRTVPSWALPYVELMGALMGRLQALADTHTLLSQANWQSVDLASLVERVAGRLVPKDDGRFALAGPALQLRPKAALALGLVLHELAMNAARHGAWSAPCGKVSCRWSRVDGAVAFEWSETGLENLAPPTRKGFGFRLINQAVAYDVAGKASQTWRPEGLIYALIIPSQRL